MTAPTVFVSSSSEGLDVVALVQKLLQEGLGGAAEVRPWPGEFQLTMAYMESLERLLDESDFAVLVLTSDDRTKSREMERFSPRDNVVFEIGLFFGRLGRKRCFLIQRGDLDLKLPSNLLGIEPATFSMPPGQDLETALQPACRRIGDAIRDGMAALPSRPRLGDADRAIQTAMRKFGDRIRGTWWERILVNGEEPALSFLTIDLDDVHGAVSILGKAYGPDGVQAANWRSAAARLQGQMMIYVRECQRLDIRSTAWRPGLAEVNFDDSGDGIEGNGKFWESDESHPEDTVIKVVELRRNLDENQALTMRKGSRGERQTLVQKILATW